MTSLHTFLHTQYGYVLRGSVSQPISMGSLSNNKQKCVCECDVACLLAQSSGAVNAAD